MRRDDGTWLLTGQPIGLPAEELARIVPMRRHLLPAEPAEPVEPVAQVAPAGDVPARVTVTGPDLTTVVARLRDQTRTQIAELRAAYQITAKLSEHTIELRDRCRSTRDGVRSARGERDSSGA